MSYEIIYDRQFIDLEDGNFIPMVLMGSNNCTTSEFGRDGRLYERRARSWQIFSHLCENLMYSTKDAMLAVTENVFNQYVERYQSQYGEKTVDEIKKHFSYYFCARLKSSTTMTFGQYQGIVRTGCAKALTVEQLKDIGVHVRVSTYVYDSAKFKAEYPELTLKSNSPTTSAELKTVLDEYTEYYRGTNVSIYVDIDADEQKMKIVRRKYFNRNKNTNKELVEVDHYWTILAPNGNYLYKNTRNGYKYSYSSPQLKYATEREAQRQVDRMNKKYTYRGEYKVKFINQPTRLYIKAIEVETI